MTSSISLAAHIEVDGSDTGRAEAHALVDLVFDAAGGSVTAYAAPSPTTSSPPAGQTAPPNAGYSKAGGAKDKRIELGPQELGEVLSALADGDNGAPLNDGERLMLQAIAQAAPAPLLYDDNRTLLGSGAKFGNVSSGLARRFWSRGFELPYAPDHDQTGYRMEPEIAAVVLQVLGAHD